VLSGGVLSLVIMPDTEAVTGSIYLSDDIYQPRADALAWHLRRRYPSEDEMRVIRVATPQISSPSVSVRHGRNRG
jgi:hypothetical protein